MMKYDKQIARTVLYKRNVGAETDRDVITTFTKESTTSVVFEMVQIAQGFYTTPKTKPGRIANEKAATIDTIHDAEDNLFINGNATFNVRGISATKTIRHDLLKAIKEFDPGYIITGSKFLNPPGIKVLRTPFVDQYVHYLVPKGVDPRDAEFVISTDITVQEPVEEKKGKFWNETNEWIMVELHDPDVFVKVQRTK